MRHTASSSRPSITGATSARVAATPVSVGTFGASPVTRTGGSILRVVSCTAKRRPARATTPIMVGTRQRVGYDFAANCESDTLRVEMVGKFPTRMRTIPRTSPPTFGGERFGTSVGAPSAPASTRSPSYRLRERQRDPTGAPARPPTVRRAAGTRRSTPRRSCADRRAGSDAARDTSPLQQPHRARARRCACRPTSTSGRACSGRRTARTERIPASSESRDTDRRPPLADTTLPVGG